MGVSGSSTRSQEETTVPTPVSASRKKLKLTKEAEKASLEASQNVNDAAGQGYRLIDIKKFATSLSKAHVCGEGKIGY